MCFLYNFIFPQNFYVLKSNFLCFFTFFIPFHEQEIISLTLICQSEWEQREKPLKLKENTTKRWRWLMISLSKDAWPKISNCQLSLFDMRKGNLIIYGELGKVGESRWLYWIQNSWQDKSSWEQRQPGSFGIPEQTIETLACKLQWKTNTVFILTKKKGV